MPKLTINFEDMELLQEFTGWFLDGGGDQEFDQNGEYQTKYDPATQVLDIERTPEE